MYNAYSLGKLRLVAYISVFEGKHNLVQLLANANHRKSFCNAREYETMKRNWNRESSLRPKKKKLIFISIYEP